MFYLLRLLQRREARKRESILKVTYGKKGEDDGLNIENQEADNECL